ncbi:hypothetical protein [Lichenicoccus sp.]
MSNGLAGLMLAIALHRLAQGRVRGGRIAVGALQVMAQRLALALHGTVAP